MKLKLMSALIIAALVLPFTITETQAQSACKGLDQAACGKNTSCSWVNSYKRQGKTVNGYCRMSGKKASKPAKKASKPAKKASAKKASKVKTTKKKTTTKKKPARKKPAKKASKSAKS